jgi:hypothetical protein
MSQQELLKRVVDVLDAAGVPYMATGSIVSSLQGEPRSTHDIDLVVAITPAGAQALLKAFPPPDYYLDDLAVREAMRRRDMFNLLDITQGDKVDFWILKDEPFDQECFSRRYAEQLPDLELFVSRPEDTILQKLRWANLSGGSEKQFVDALRVYEVQFQRLDLEYIGQWAKRLDVQGEWLRLQQEAEPL